MNEFDGITSLRATESCLAVTLVSNRATGWMLPNGVQFVFKSVTERNDCFTVVFDGVNFHVFESAKTDLIKK